MSTRNNNTESFKTAASTLTNGTSFMTASSNSSGFTSKLLSQIRRVVPRAMPVRKAYSNYGGNIDARSGNGRNTRSMISRVNVTRPRFLNLKLWPKRGAKTYEFNQYVRGNLTSDNDRDKVVSVSAVPVAERQRIAKLFGDALDRTMRAQRLLSSIDAKTLRNVHQQNSLKRYKTDVALLIQDLRKQQTGWAKAIQQMNQGKRGPWKLRNWPMTPLQARMTTPKNPTYYEINPPWQYMRRNHQMFTNRVGKGYAALLASASR